MENKNIENTNSLSPKKEYKQLGSENSKINKLLKKILKHIKYLDKQLIFFTKFGKKNPNLDKSLELLMGNFKETLANLKKERDFIEQKHLDNKILIDKLQDQTKDI